MASKLLDSLRRSIRLRHYSYRTEQAYVMWAIRYIRFHKYQHPAEMGDKEVEAFLSHLAVERSVSANTQNQALNALAYLYKQILQQPLGELRAIRAKRPKKVPVILSRDEIRKLLLGFDGQNRLIGSLLYGSGLRLMEALQIRIKDVDFGYACLHIHNAKGQKDRVVTLPQQLHDTLRVHIEHGRVIHDPRSGTGFWRGVSARCAITQIQACGPIVSLAVSVPFFPNQ